MAVEGATWIYQGYGDYEGYSVQYFIKGDTVLNNKTYKILHESYSINENINTAFIRDDTINRKVYSFSLGSIFGTCSEIDSLSNLNWLEEMLLFDFDFEVGDSTNLCLYGSDYNYSFNSIEYKNLYGESLRCISEKDSIEYLSDINMIEGIGSVDGFPESLGLVIAAGLGYGLVEYCISDNGKCTTANQNILDDSEIKIYPNPSSDIINIETNKTILSTSIYDFSGRRILQTKTNNIDLSALDPGPYLMEVLLKNEYIYRAKITKI